jgi:SOS response regulatory protein OraA/RecX
MVGVKEQVSWSEARAYSRLLARLNLSDLSRQQAFTFLVKRGCPSEVAEVAVARCMASGLIDDARMLEGMQARADRSLWSQRQLQQKLYQKGLNLDAGGMALDQEQSACELLRRWVDKGLDLEKAKLRLLRRGFPASSVRAAWAALTDSLERDAPGSRGAQE